MDKQDKQTSGGTHKPIDRQTTHTSRQKDTYRQTTKHTDQQTNEQIEERTEGQTQGLANEQAD